MQEVDMGVYTCTVSAWNANGQGELVKLAEQQSAPHTIQWTAKSKDTPFVVYSFINVFIYIYIVAMPHMYTLIMYLIWFLKDGD